MAEKSWMEAGREWMEEHPELFSGPMTATEAGHDASVKERFLRFVLKEWIAGCN